MTTPLTSATRRAASLAGVLALALASAACGSDADDDAEAAGRADVADAGGDTDGGGATGEDAAAPAPSCPLDAAELTAAIGMEMEPKPGSSCGFAATEPGSGRLLEVYYTGVDAMVYEGSEGEPVAGVGDGARWDESMSKSLIVKDGRRHFSIQVLSMGTGIPPEMEARPLSVKVAELVLEG